MSLKHLPIKQTNHLDKQDKVGKPQNYPEVKDSVGERTTQEQWKY
jgi:hypothetical protein